MNIDKLQIAARQRLADWFVPVAVLLLLVALASGIGVYSAVATPDEQTAYDTVDAWETTAEFSHGATVTEPNAVYSVGEELTDRPRYYTDVMPDLAAEIQYSYQAADGDVDIETDITRVTRAVDSSDDSVVYWRDEQTLDSTETNGLTPGETHNDSVTVDVASMDQTATETAETLGSTAGTLETVLQIDVRMDGHVDGEPVEHTEQYELPIEVTSGTYTVELPSETGHVEQQSVAVSTDWTDNVGDAVGVLALLVLSVGGLGGLAVAKHRDRLAPTAAEQHAIKTESERQTLEEWISRGELPTAVDERPRIQVASLTELVDVAIDCNRRVIDRDTTAEYVVVDDTVVYGFRPQAAAEQKDKPCLVDEGDTVSTDSKKAESVDEPADAESTDNHTEQS